LQNRCLKLDKYQKMKLQIQLLFNRLLTLRQSPLHSSNSPFYGSGEIWIANFAIRGDFFSHDRQYKRANVGEQIISFAPISRLFTHSWLLRRRVKTASRVQVVYLCKYREKIQSRRSFLHSLARGHHQHRRHPASRVQKQAISATVFTQA
jgi:hypothetical protein